MGCIRRGRKGNAELGISVAAGCGDRAAVQLHNLFGNRQAKPCAPCPAGTRGIQAVKFLKDPLQLLLWDARPGVAEKHIHLRAVPLGRNRQLRPLWAVVDSVAQKVVEHTGEFVRIAHFAVIREGESVDDFMVRRQDHYDYTVELPIRLVNTADGWRVDEFNLPGYDGWRYEEHPAG